MTEETLEFRRCTLTLSTPAPWVVTTRLVGYLEIDATERLIAYRDRVLEQVEAFHEFHHWMESTGYDTDTRRALTDHSLKYRDRIAGIHVLTDSRLVMMGISVGSLVLGDLIRSYDAAEDFERALGEAQRVAPTPRR